MQDLTPVPRRLLPCSLGGIPTSRAIEEELDPRIVVVDAAVPEEAELRVPLDASRDSLAAGPAVRRGRLPRNPAPAGVAALLPALHRDDEARLDRPLAVTDGPAPRISGGGL